MLGGVELLEADPRVWVTRDRAAALEFVMAGSAAELRALGHHLPGSYDGDLHMWRRGLDHPEGMDAAELNALVGEPFADIWNRTQAWVADNWTRIAHIVRCLAGVGGTSDEIATVDWTDESCRLTEAQILHHLADPMSG